MDYGSGIPGNKPSAVFDPFHITQNHSKHSQVSKIIRLEESNRLFCPLCLEEIASTNIQNVENQHIEQYIQNLFEALDQNYEVLQLKCIVLKILEITFKKRPGIVIQDDNDFHNYLRVLYKLINCQHFSPLDYSAIAEIFAGLSCKFKTDNPIPFVSVWKTLRCMIDYAKKHLFHDDLKDFTLEDIHNFIGGSAIVVKTFLNLLNSHMVHQTIDLIFPVYEGEPIFQSRKWFIDGQEECLKFIDECINSSVWIGVVSKEQSLVAHEQSMVRRVFEALEGSFTTSVRLNSNFLLDTLNRIDCFKIAHLLIYRNKDKDFRDSIRLFLRRLVMHYTEQLCGTDDYSRQFFQEDDLVELNHKNAIAFSFNSMKNKRTIFYILVNNVAKKLDSRYFNEVRVKKVMKCIEPEQTAIIKSKVFVRSYMMLLIKLARRITSFNTAERFIRKVMTDCSVVELNERFCYNRDIFFWIHEDWQFVKQRELNSLDYMISKSTENNTLSHDLNILSKSKYYKNLILTYIQDEHLALKLIDELLKADLVKNLPIQDAIEHEKLISHIGFNMLAQFHSSIIESLNVTFSFNEEPEFGMIKPLLAIMQECKHFKFVLDMHFIRDFFKLLEVLYKRKTGEKKVRVLTYCTDFITCLIETDVQCIMKVLKHMNYRILGYMFNYLGNRPIDNSLSESIARLLVAYDKLNYPIINNIGDAFHPLASNLIRWIWSNNQDLHWLTLLVLKRTLNSTLDYTTRLSLSTGLLHIIYSKSNVINDPACLRTINSLLDLEDIKNNPLLHQNVVPWDAPDIIKEKASQTHVQLERPMSVISFSSDSETKSLFEEARQNVFNILNGFIHDDQDLTSNISQETLLAKSLGHQGIEATEDWEELQCLAK